MSLGAPSSEHLVWSPGFSRKGILHRPRFRLKPRLRTRTLGLVPLWERRQAQILPKFFHLSLPEGARLQRVVGSPMRKILSAEFKFADAWKLHKCRPVVGTIDIIHRPLEVLALPPHLFSLIFHFFSGSQPVSHLLPLLIHSPLLGLMPDRSRYLCGVTQHTKPQNHQPDESHSNDDDARDDQLHAPTCGEAPQKASRPFAAHLTPKSARSERLKHPGGAVRSPPTFNPPPSPR